MDSLKVARIAKFVALFGFFLPWVLVSCNGTPVAKATGLQLAMGRMTMLVGNTPQGDPKPVVVVILIILVIIAGIVLSFRLADQMARARALVATSAASLLLCWITLGTLEGDLRKSSGNGSEAAAAAMLKIQPELGYWITVLSLLAAGGLAGAVYFGRQSTVDDVLRRGAAGLTQVAASAGSGGSDADVRFWDQMGDKNDPDLLQEYVFRFPDGRFVELARARLATKGVEPITPPAPPLPPPPSQPAPAVEAAPPAATAATALFCGECGTKIEDPADRFCDSCGAEVVR